MNVASRLEPLNKLYGTEIIIIVVCTITSAFSANTERGIQLWGMLIMWRVFLGTMRSHPDLT